jgi:membrane protein implicated in regulation of membrane protease activity
MPRPSTLAVGLLAFWSGLATVEWIALITAFIALAVALYSLWVGERRAVQDRKWREQQVERAESLGAALHERVDGEG